MMSMSHETCTHPRTPAGRAACRKAGGPNPMANADKIDTALPLNDIEAKNKAIGAEMASRKPPRKNNAQDRGINSVRMTPKRTKAEVTAMITAANSVALPVGRRAPKVTTSDMPRIFRTVVEWADANDMHHTAYNGRAKDTVIIEVASRHGNGLFTYSRATPNGVHAVSFRPAGTSVTSRMATVNDVLNALMKG